MSNFNETPQAPQPGQQGAQQSAPQAASSPYTGYTGQSAQQGGAQQGSSSHGPAQGAPQGPAPAAASRPSASDKFFGWIRSSRIVRPNDRWIAGVCGAVARQLGWSVTLVRVLMIVATLFFGFGAYFYALGWLLLPDEATGEILAEDMVHGHWDWGMLGVILCALVAILTGGVGWWNWSPLGVNVTSLVLAAFLLYLLIEHGVRRAIASFQQPVQPGQAQPGAPRPQGAYQPGPYAQQAYGPQPQPGTPGAQPQPSRPAGAQQPHRSATAQQGSGAAQPGAASQPNAPRNPYAQPASSVPYYQTSGVPQNPASQPYQYQPYQQPAYPQGQPAAAPAAQAERAYTPRRKPAGPFIVLTVLGALLIGAAITTTLIGTDYTLKSWLGDVLVACGIACIAIGALIIVLGCRGRRSGGLIPITWIAMLLTCSIVALFCVYSTFYDRTIVAGENFESVYVGTPTTVTPNAYQLKEMASGIAVAGSNYDDAQLNLDLTGKQLAGEHDITLNDGTTATSNCPTGTIKASVVNAQLSVTIPDGCSFSITGVSSADGMEYDAANGTAMPIGSIGDRNVIVGYDGEIEFYLGHASNDDGSSFHFGVTDRRSSIETISTDCSGIYTTPDGETVVDKDFATARQQNLIKNGKYWPCAVDDKKAPKTPELTIEVEGLVSGSVDVQYASEAPSTKDWKKLDSIMLVD